MSDVTVVGGIPAMSDAAIAQVRALEAEALKLPQVDIATSHVFHAGVYARTIVIPAGVLLTGALIKCATLLIVSGEVFVFLDDEGATGFSGYTVLPASAGRKVAFFARTDTHLTMIFATDAADVAEAEGEFTGEPELLLSRLPGAANTVTRTERRSGSAFPRDPLASLAIGSAKLTGSLVRSARADTAETRSGDAGGE
jgi:hypothetical protein